MLEDFFTPTELKDGLACAPRVEELVSTLHNKNKHTDLNNIGEMITHWLTVATVLVCTSDVESLQRFVELDGLKFLSCWLDETLSHYKDSESKAAVEFLNRVLTLLDLLAVSEDQAVSSGVKMAVQQLISHGNSEVNKKAMSLHEKWNSVVSQSDMLNLTRPGMSTECSKSNETQYVEAELKTPGTICSVVNTGSASQSETVHDSPVLMAAPVSHSPLLHQSKNSSPDSLDYNDIDIGKDEDPSKGGDDSIIRRTSKTFDWNCSDALEVARQVAIDVEQEVIDYREGYHSSPNGSATSNQNHIAEHDESVEIKCETYGLDLNVKYDARGQDCAVKPELIAEAVDTSIELDIPQDSSAPGADEMPDLNDIPKVLTDDTLSSSCCPPRPGADQSVPCTLSCSWLPPLKHFDLNSDAMSITSDNDGAHEGHPSITILGARITVTSDKNQNAQFAPLQPCAASSSGVDMMAPINSCSGPTGSIGSTSMPSSSAFRFTPLNFNVGGNPDPPFLNFLPGSASLENISSIGAATGSAATVPEEMTIFGMQLKRKAPDSSLDLLSRR